MLRLGNLMLCALVLINGYLFLWRAGYIIHATRRSSNSATSALGRDYPIMLDVGNLDLVAMTLHESTRFTLMKDNDEAFNKTWETLITNPPASLGRVHYGKDNRVLAATLMHQLHCVLTLARAFRYSPSKFETKHLHHCLNYLRQTLLCNAADTLEEGDFMLKDFEVDRVGGTALCWDWEKVYDTMGRDYQQWKGHNTKADHEHLHESS